MGDWRRVNETLRMTAALEADGAILQGVTFWANCMAQKPDEKLALMLMAETRLKPRAFARVDWRGPEHQNNEKICGDLRFLNASRTHFHDTVLHQHIEIEEIFSEKYDLPIAVAIQPEPYSFMGLLEIAADLLHIENLTGIQTPSWEAPQTSLI